MRQDTLNYFEGEGRGTVGVPTDAQPTKCLSKRQKVLCDLENEIDALNERCFGSMQDVQVLSTATTSYSDRLHWNKRDEDHVQNNGSRMSAETISGSTHAAVTDDDVWWSSKEDELKMIELLRECFGKHGITESAQHDIINILRAHGHPSLPQCRTLMRTPRSVGHLLQKVSNGKMYYFGIEAGIRASVSPEYLSQCKSIGLDFFWDGLSPYKSVANKVWPILGRLCATEFSEEGSPFLVSIFNGKSDPHPAEFLKDFLKEAKNLQTNGIKIQEVRYEVIFLKFIADYPARCRMKCVNGEGPGSLVQCERCTIIGKHRGGTNFSSVEMRRSNPTLRTDSSFRRRLQPKYHTHSKTGPRDDSPLLQLDIDMVFDIPLDPMHILYQGILRRWWTYQVDTKKGVDLHLKKQYRLKISKYMEELGKYFPSEFARRVRGLLSFKLYKATEWRRFCLYDGILVAKKFLAPAAYRNLLLLSCAVRILSSQNLLDQGLLSDAENLLKLFVADVEKNFGKTFMSIKVHSLLHMAKECENHGVLEAFSAFPFESYLNRINKTMRAHGRCIEQIVSRSLEGNLLQPSTVKMRGSGKPTLKLEIESTRDNCKEWLQVSVHSMTIRANSLRDSTVKTLENDIVKVTSIFEDTSANELYVVGHKFVFSSNFFHWPVKSKSIGIEKVWGLSAEKRRWKVSNLKCKCVLLKIEPSSSDWLCLELVHGSEKG